MKGRARCSRESKMIPPHQPVNRTLLYSAFLLLVEEHLIQQSAPIVQNEQTARARARSLTYLFRQEGETLLPDSGAT
jgi:hypothetical protein